MSDKLREECGIFGIYNKTNIDAVNDAYLALFALQHRGQESCGIAVNDRGVFRHYKDLGLVPDVFTKRNLDELGEGNIAVGHCRYAPSDKQERANAQPLVMRYIKGTFAIAHNGSITNIPELREELERGGAVFHTTCDAEYIANTIARERPTAGSIEIAVSLAMNKIKGAYSLVLMSPRKLIAARDPSGFRPLCMGRLNDSVVFASESCALDSIGAEFVRDIQPGEIVVADDSGVRSIKDHCGKKSGLCVFEHVYFARPDSMIDGMSVHIARRNAGKYLAIEHPVEADMVMGVPDCGVDAALGYAEESGIPFGLGFVKNRYIGRTFIKESQKARERAVHIKLNPVPSVVRGKRLVLVDDSIVRGTTCGKIIKLLRDAGAREVHMRVASPLFLHPCYFGTDIGSRDKLIACKMSVEEICRHFKADSWGYLSMDGIRKTTPDSTCGFCYGCFTGEYPIEVEGENTPDKFAKKIN